MTSIVGGELEGPIFNSHCQCVDDCPPEVEEEEEEESNVYGSPEATRLALCLQPPLPSSASLGPRVLSLNPGKVSLTFVTS